MNKRPTVLVVDDDQGIRAAMATRLNGVGFDVRTAADGAQALAAIQKEELDAALIDVKLPDIDGFAVCEHIRKTDSAIPVFMLTGADDGIVRDFLGTLTSVTGGNHYVIKPCDGKEVADRIWAAVHKAPTR